MEKVKLVYEHYLRCKITNGSQKDMVIDAPKEFGGREEAMSPTEALVGVLGSCMTMFMAVVAQKHGISLEGLKLEGSKKMAEAPLRRIDQITLHFSMPAGIAAAKRKIIEQVARSCPVGQSLHPDIQYTITFQYPD